MPSPERPKTPTWPPPPKTPVPESRPPNPKTPMPPALGPPWVPKTPVEPAGPSHWPCTPTPGPLLLFTPKTPGPVPSACPNTPAPGLVLPTARPATPLPASEPGRPKIPLPPFGPPKPATPLKNPAPMPCNPSTFVEPAGEASALSTPVPSKSDGMKPALALTVVVKEPRAMFSVVTVCDAAWARSGPASFASPAATSAAAPVISPRRVGGRRTSPSARSNSCARCSLIWIVPQSILSSRRGRLEALAQLLHIRRLRRLGRLHQLLDRVRQLDLLQPRARDVLAPGHHPIAESQAAGPTLLFADLEPRRAPAAHIQAAGVALRYWEDVVVVSLDHRREVRVQLHLSLTAHQARPTEVLEPRLRALLAVQQTVRAIGMGHGRILGPARDGEVADDQDRPDETPGVATLRGDAAIDPIPARGAGEPHAAGRGRAALPGDPVAVLGKAEDAVAVGRRAHHARVRVAGRGRPADHAGAVARVALDAGADARTPVNTHLAAGPQDSRACVQAPEPENADAIARSGMGSKDTGRARWPIALAEHADPRRSVVVYTEKHRGRSQALAQKLPRPDCCYPRPPDELTERPRTPTSSVE